MQKQYPNRKPVPVYVKTGNASRQALPPEEKCGRFLCRDLLDVLDRFPDTGDTIVDNFRTHLQDWENETNSYRDVHFSKWNGWCREGFYIELENQMVKEGKWNRPKWEYVHNPAGELLCFTFAETPMAQEPHEVAMYLQIDDATRLIVRLSGNERIQATFMQHVLELLEDNARQAGDVRIKKAGRFRGGETGAVAEVTFGDENSYIALKDGGIVDMDATMQRLDRAREFVSKVASL